jgi:hypothetical protein
VIWATSVWCGKTREQFWGWTLFEQFVQDIRYASRAMLANRRVPRFVGREFSF